MTELALPDGVFPSVRAAYDAHDKACVSLRYMWLGRTGGVSCLSDLGECTGCDVTFYWDGLHWVNHQDESADEVYLCGCCAGRRGTVLVDGPHGVHA